MSVNPFPKRGTVPKVTGPPRELGMVAAGLFCDSGHMPGTWSVATEA